MLAAVDRTVTGPGARLLETRLTAPSADRRAILERQAAVAHFVEAPEILQAVRERLRRLPDLERALSRLALDRGGPRDLGVVRDALAEAGRIRDMLDGALPDALAEAREALERA